MDKLGGPAAEFSSTLQFDDEELSDLAAAPAREVGEGRAQVELTFQLNEWRHLFLEPVAVLRLRGTTRDGESFDYGLDFHLSNPEAAFVRELDDATLVLRPRSGVSGSEMRAVGRRFPGGEPVHLFFGGDYVAETTANRAGKFVKRFQVPAESAVGSHPVVALSQSGGFASAEFSVPSQGKQRRE
ncbi:MAG: hypothetical protein ACE5GX_02775 [Thermoanaerobaculia bacterium]